MRITRNATGWIVRSPALGIIIALMLLGAGSGCATIRVTDPYRTATEQFLMSESAQQAVAGLAVGTLRDRVVFLDATYLIGTNPTPPSEALYIMGEVRALLLNNGVRLAATREEAQVIVEVRSGGTGIDRVEFLLGIPATYLPGSSSATGTLTVATPELALIKRTTQLGFSSVAIAAYWRDTGEMLMTSAPKIGRKSREDYWFFGFGPHTVGDIVPTSRAKAGE